MVAIRLAVRIWLLTCVVGICGLTLSADGPYTAYPCAAFAIDGRSATGTITSTSLQLRIFDASGQSQQAALVYKGAPSDCRIFFPGQGDYLIAAVGLHSGKKQWLRIGALNTDIIKWTSNFSVEPRPGFDSPILAGFLRDGSTLVVMGYKREPSAERSTGVRSVLINARGKVADLQGVCQAGGRRPRHGTQPSLVSQSIRPLLALRNFDRQSGRRANVRSARAAR